MTTPANKARLILALRSAGITDTEVLSAIERVPDRLGHDRRYSVDCSKVKQLGWAPEHDFPAALERTVAWYRDNRDWWEPLKARA